MELVMLKLEVEVREVRVWGLNNTLILKINVKVFRRL